MAFGSIIAIRVRDIQRGLWFNWDAGSWDQSPSCRPGTNAVYVAFYAKNTGVSGVLALKLIEASTGVTLASKVEYVSTNSSIGIEWTGNMPTGGYSLTCSVTP